MTLDQNTLEYIFSKLTVTGFVTDPGGGKQVHLGINDIVKHRDDYHQFCADHHKLTLEQFELWMEVHGAPRCGEKTKSGKRCKKPCGRKQMPAWEWLERDGGLCAYHERQEWDRKLGRGLS